MIKYYLHTSRQMVCLFIVAFAFGLSYQSQAQVINTIAGSGTRGYNGEGSPATLKHLKDPFGIAVDASENVYFADRDNNCIRKITPSGTISTIAGDATLPALGAASGIPATDARFNSPYGVHIDAAQNIYISDAGNGVVRKIDAVTNIITTIAGNSPSPSYSGDGGQATNAGLSYPTAVAVDAAGNVFIADYSNYVVRKVDPSGIITTVAGSNVFASIGGEGDGGPATAAKLSNVYSVVVDAAGNLFIADYNYSRIRKVNTSGIISTFATFGLDRVTGMTIDANDTLYVAHNGGRIVKISPVGVKTVIAGSGITGFRGDGGSPVAAEFNNPSCVALGPTGNIYITDLVNQRIRAITFPIVTIGPITGTMNLCRGATTTLTNTTAGGTWSSLNNSVATIDIFSGVVTGVAPGISSIVYATSSGNAITTVTVDPLPNTGKILGLNTACPGSTAILSNYVTGGIWSSSNEAVAAISSTGIVTAIAPGTTTIYYAIATGCGGSTSIKYPFKVFTNSECFATGINPVSENATTITAFPNPNKGSFTINLSANVTEDVRVVVTNVVGIKVGEYLARTNVPLDIKLDAPAGVYFLSAASEHGKWSEKVLVTSTSSR